MGNITRSKNVKEKQFNQVKALCNTGLSFRKIAGVIGYSPITVSRIAKADTFKAYKEYHKREALKRKATNGSREPLEGVIDRLIEVNESMIEVLSLLKTMAQ